MLNFCNWKWLLGNKYKKDSANYFQFALKLRNLRSRDFAKCQHPERILHFPRRKLDLQETGPPFSLELTLIIKIQIRVRIKSGYEGKKGRQLSEKNPKNRKSLITECVQESSLPMFESTIRFSSILVRCCFV